LNAHVYLLASFDEDEEKIKGENTTNKQNK
jgi:hypothetical protein